MNNFPSLLEGVLVNIWGGNKERLDGRQLRDTRRAIAQIRAIYRFKGEHGTQQPSKINYRLKNKRAGYIAGFGERHAYLPYLQLREVNAIKPDAIPQPRGKKNELTVTSLGAGACIELYGICLYYMGGNQQPLYLNLNWVEREREWIPNRGYVFAKVLKESFPKLDIDPLDICLDLREDNIIKLAQHYDRLLNTDILIIYNVLNEIPSGYTRHVWRNLKFLLDIFQKPVLILMMEPSSDRAEPRIHPLKTQLAQETNIITESKVEQFVFNAAPVCIEMNASKECLNHRLFGIRIDGGRPPTFETTIRRSHMACIKVPNSPITMEQVSRQLFQLEAKRGRRGAFIAHRDYTGKQASFKDIDSQWNQ